jgi:hypothetical protein
MVNKSKSHEAKNRGKTADEKGRMKRTSNSRNESMKDNKGSNMTRTDYNKDMKDGGKNAH